MMNMNDPWIIAYLKRTAELAASTRALSDREILADTPYGRELRAARIKLGIPLPPAVPVPVG